VIILTGESASGKSTIETILSDKYGYKKTVSYTTRPMREGEVDGVDYYFISQDEFTEKFNNNFFIEVGSYNGWFYGTTSEQYTDDTVCVLTPHGLRQIKKKLGGNLNINTFYIKVPRRDRLIKILERGDNIDEAIRRNQSDVGQYDGIEDEVDYVLENKGYTHTPDEIVLEILKEVK
jgi:guanylate kinase